MIIYEVNLLINQAIAHEFMPWLETHVKEMMTFQGFVQAQFLKQTTDLIDAKLQLTIQYSLESMQALDDYLANHAPKMRADGLEKFPDQFSATRRVFSVKSVVKKG